MARNKREQDKNSKRAEIVAAARRLFLEEGYEASSMTRIATAAGVAANTIYWYFADKDDVLVAVLDAEFADAMAAYLQHPFPDVTARMLWVVQQLMRVSRLVGTVHARVAASPVVAQWHDRFHAIAEGMVRTELQEQGLAAARIDALVKIWVFTVEGLLAHPVSTDEQRRICDTLARL